VLQQACAMVGCVPGGLERGIAALLERAVGAALQGGGEAGGGSGDAT
jgi:hypothetical protein